MGTRGSLAFTVVTTAIKISLVWFVSNVLFVSTLTFVWNASLSVLSLVVTRAVTRIVLWFVLFVCLFVCVE